MPLYLKRPETVEAERFDPSGPGPWPLSIWPHPAQIPEGSESPNAGSWGHVDTVAGRKAVHAGDWIVTNKQGKRRLFKADEFDSHYTPAPEGKE